MQSALKGQYPVKKGHYAIPSEEAVKLQAMLKKHEKLIEKIDIMGVETNVCILANAVVMQSLFPDANIVIHEQLCRSGNQTLARDALFILERLGMNIRRIGQ